MKHRPSHLKQFEKKQERSEHEIEHEEMEWKKHYMHERTARQIKKQAKQKVKADKKNKVHMPKDLEEKNKLQKNRAAVIRKRSHQPRPQK